MRYGLTTKTLEHRYTIAWKRCVPNLELAESVEFKSLPSGLHNVEEDLVYFMHDDEHAGISAFINRSASHWDRNALMLAVGALVPLENGRLGRSWKHAEYLKQLAEHLVLDPTKTKPLEDYWEANKLSEETPTELSGSRSGSSQQSEHDRPRSQSSLGPSRKRAISSASMLGSPGQGLSPHHPALSLPSLLDTFGPLVFPLYKAALLRKRILMVTQAPVELSFYDVSILSNIPSSVASLIPLVPLPTRLRPLFSVGVHDIDTLTESYRLSQLPKNELAVDEPGYGWVACTTDNVLGAKSSLYDVLVTIPPSYSKQAKEKVWPKLQNAIGAEMKASQRDLRRYRTLKQEIRRTRSRSRAASPFNPRRRNDDDNDDDDDQTTLLPIENTQETFDDSSSTSDEKLIEPLSWSTLAYSSFMWWASAGEKRADLEEESEHDASLFRDFSDYSGSASARPRSRRRSSPGPNLMQALMTDGSPAAPEMGIIAYFHRLTALILGVLAHLVDLGDDGIAPDGRTEGTDDKDDVVFVDGEDMTRMGLDVWSEGDRRFVEELLEFYWGRKSEIQGGRVECCGVRIC
ncbi:hypothetical protein MMC11_000735 [Xylographa trunciseda]|nr:hypothetical protein [Xylographa trunciseda]